MNESRIQASKVVSIAPSETESIYFRALQIAAEEKFNDWSEGEADKNRIGTWTAAEEVRQVIDWVAMAREELRKESHKESNDE